MKIKKLKENRNQKGITLIGIVITIIVLLILAGVSIALLIGQNGILNQATEATESIEKSEAEEIAKLLANEYKIVEATENTKTLDEFLSEKISTGEIDDYFPNNDGLGTYIVIIGKYEGILSAKGILEDEMYLSTGLGISNITILDENNEKVNNGTILKGEEITINFDIINRNSENGTLTDIVISPQLPYITANETTEFTITGKIGTEEVQIKRTISITNKYLEFETQASVWNGEIQTPELSDMAKITWDSDKLLAAPETDNNWYKYTDTSINEANTSNWANVIMKDGSYFVWIPRYEYKIIYTNPSNKSAGGTIDIKFIPVTQTTPSEGYKIHPAFEDGSDNNFMNGEWDKELAGIWVGKFEMTGTEAEPTTKPNIESLRSITLGQVYNVIQKYDEIIGNTELESHLMKNSEWGATAYLAHSKYGRNGTEVEINSNSEFKTGGGNYKANTNQSTTGNVHGIYDLSGGVWERTAAYISNGNSNLITYGWEGIYSIANTNGYLTKSTKYATVYPYTNEDVAVNYDRYSTLSNNEYGYGDAIIETSVSSVSPFLSSWNGDYSCSLSIGTVVFIRGGSINNGMASGIFAFTNNNGKINNVIGSRMVVSP